MPNLKPALSPKLQDEQCGLLQKDWGLCLSPLSMQCPVAGSLLRTTFQCHSPMDPDSSSLSGHQGWVIKGCPLGFRYKNWVSDMCKAPLQEILVLWSVAVCVKMVPVGYTKAKGEYKDGEKREMVPTSLHLPSVSLECSNRL